jgi:uncharacterized protein YgiM (DUF1202 family)
MRLRHLSKSSYLALFLLIITTAVSAQAADCVAILQQAISNANEACATVGRNQACLGNGTINAQLQPGFESASFSQAGDIIDAAAIQSITSTSSDDTWGVTVLRLQMNMADHLEDQNVTVLLLGDVQLNDPSAVVVEEAVEAATPVPEPVTLDVTANGTANVRSGPSKNDGVIASLSGDDVVTGNGRNADNTWIRIELADGEGWVFADLVTVDGDVSTLNVVEAAEVVESTEIEAEAPKAPLSAFNFISGGGESACAGELPSGIVVQSPDQNVDDPTTGMQMQIRPVVFTMNNTEIVMGSTFWATNTADGEMAVNVVEDYAQATSDAMSAIALAGSQAIVNQEGAPQVSDISQVDLEPLINFFKDLDKLLPRQVVVPDEPETDPDAWAEVLYENFQARKLVVSDGFWLLQKTPIALYGNCPVNSDLFPAEERIITLDELLEVDDTGIITGMNTGDGFLPLTPGFPGQYTRYEEFDITSTQVTVQVYSPLYIDYTIVGNINDGVNGCQMLTNMSLSSCLLDVAAKKTKGDGWCPAEIHQAMGTA